MDFDATSNSSTALNTSILASGTTSGSAYVATFNDAGFVLHINFFLAALFGCFVVYRLPRGLARLTRLSEWTRGFILYHAARDDKDAAAPAPRPRSYFSTSGRPVSEISSRGSFRSMWTDRSVGPTKESSGRTDPSVAHYPHSLHTVGETKRRFKLYPPHIPSSPAFFRTIASWLGRRMSTDYSLGQLILLAIYLGVMLYAALYKSNPLADPIRTGFVAMSQVPIVFALAAKNGVLGWLTGIGYERLNFLHREAGKLVGLYVNIHALGYFYTWSVAGTLSASLKKPSNAWGFVGLVCVDVLYLLSTPFWRRKAYNVFLTSHLISIAVLLLAMVLHKSSMTVYVLSAAGIYGFDHVMRVVKSRYSYARLRPMPEMGGTLVEIPGINMGWRAGQFIRLRVLTTELGWFGWAETHPFTIAAVSDADEGMVLLAKKAGDWTDKLYEMAKRGGYSEDGLGGARIAPVIVEGPYGGPGHQVFTSYSAAVFVVGGSGISYAISAILEIVQQDIKGASRVKHIEMIWFTQDYASVGPMLPLFNSLLAQSEPTPLRITVNYTRASRKPVIEKDTSLPGITVSPIKPKIGKVIEATVDRTTSFGSGMKDSDTLNGVMVAVCGPPGLGDQVSAAVRNVDSKKRDAVGGIELYEESFDW